MTKPAYWAALEGAAIDGVSLPALARDYGTPLYVYHSETMQQNLAQYLDVPHPPKVHYAVKANSNLTLLKRMASWGAGFDIVSLGELERVLLAGGKPENIIFSGVGKTPAELTRAISLGIGCLNVESVAELKEIQAIAEQLGKKANISLRVNPNVDAKTHPYISTGMRDNKFGIAIDNAAEVYQAAQRSPWLKIRGISCHIGSQIITLSPYLQAFASIIALADSLEAAGIHLEYLDIGGGVGIQMDAEMQVPKVQNLIAELYRMMGKRPYELHLQPGRSIVGNAGFLLTQVLTEKEQSGKHFTVIDAAMNDYIRPALYQAHPHFLNLTPESQATEKRQDIVGPICESGDCFSKDVVLAVKSGDILAIGGVGAYGMSMSSQYNSRPRAAEVLIENGKAILIRKRDTLAQLWENELL